MVQEGPNCTHPLLTHCLRPCHSFHTMYGGTPEESPPGKAKVAFPNVSLCKKFAVYEYVCKYS